MEKFLREPYGLTGMARVHKALSKGSHDSLGLLKDRDGNLTHNFADTLELLLKTHFPGCIINSNTLDHREANACK